jgi:release factor glutamine methyltransferase
MSSAAPVSSVRDALSAAEDALRAAGCDTPRLDAELLLAHAMGVSRETLFMDTASAVSPAAARRAMELIRRRVAREPVAYITGVKGFRHIDLAVDRRVLIPRPETELLVEVALGLTSGARVHDVGTGSGAIALALKQERTDAEVVACDISDDALAVARGNAERLGLEVTFVQSDLLAGVPGDAFFLIASNPPYVAEADLAGLEPEVAVHEPRLATAAGDGFDVYRRLLPDAAARLAPGGALVLECGAGQAGALVAELERLGYRDPGVDSDLAGIERVVWATWQ